MLKFEEDTMKKDKYGLYATPTWALVLVPLSLILAIVGLVMDHPIIPLIIAVAWVVFVQATRWKLGPKERSDLSKRFNGEK